MEKTKRKGKNQSKFKNTNIILILGLIYVLITVLAIISYASQMNNMSTTVVTFGTIIGAVWWQILMIGLFVITYILYNKKTILGILLEIIMGIAMLIYIIISVAIMGIDFLALLIELVYPLILTFHGLTELKKHSRS